MRFNNVRSCCNLAVITCFVVFSPIEGCGRPASATVTTPVTVAQPPDTRASRPGCRRAADSESKTGIHGGTAGISESGVDSDWPGGRPGRAISEFELGQCWSRCDDSVTGRRGDSGSPSESDQPPRLRVTSQSVAAGAATVINIWNTIWSFESFCLALTYLLSQ